MSSYTAALLGTSILAIATVVFRSTTDWKAKLLANRKYGKNNCFHFKEYETLYSTFSYTLEELHPSRRNLLSLDVDHLCNPCNFLSGKLY